MATIKKEENNKPAVVNKNITDQVLDKVKTLQDSGLIKLPKDYSPENALKGAWIILQDVKTKEGELALKVCSSESIALALLKMITEGLSPLKKHGSFIPRGKTLSWEREYDGDVALAKRAGLGKIRSRCIYEGDDYLTKIDETGRKSLVSHEQPFENIDITKIKGAYCIFEFEGEFELLEMTISQIKQSWLQGSMKGQSGAHKNFTDEMCRRTVERRACKPIIRRSDDSYLGEYDDNGQIGKDKENANAENISFDSYEDITGKEKQDTGHVGDDPVAENTEADIKNDEAQVKLTGPGF